MVFGKWWESWREGVFWREQGIDVGLYCGEKLVRVEVIEVGYGLGLLDEATYSQGAVSYN